MAISATARTLRISPRKMGLVASLVRGRATDDALVILEHTPKKAAVLLRKVVVSAVANATTNHEMAANKLVITEIKVSPGLTLKRGRPVSRGRYHPIRRRTSHVTVVVDQLDTTTKAKEEIKELAKTGANKKESK